MSINEFVRSAGKKISPVGGAFMMSPSAAAAGQDAGLDFFGYYALGRGGVLGKCDAQAVADAFFFFNTDLVKTVWDANIVQHEPTEVAKHYAESCAAWGREKIGDIEGLDEFCKLVERVAQNAEPTSSSSLFAGWREMPLADDCPGRVAVQLALVMRELRGGAHIEAIKQVGLKPKDAVAANSPNMYQMFGWTDEMPDDEAHKAKAAQAEDITDELVAPAFSILDEAERDTFGSILGAVATKLGI